jgi:hypothetical protein
VSPGFEVDRRGVPRGDARPWNKPPEPSPGPGPCRCPSRLVAAQHGAGCDPDDHAWVKLTRGGRRFYIRQCAACYTVDFDDLEAQVDAELPKGYGPR